MFENSTELAENKLLLLYILNVLKTPISNAQLTEIVLENNFINYFTLQQYISELELSKFISYKDINEKKLLILTEKGENVLSLFNDRISPSKIAMLDNYMKDKIDLIKKELTIQSDYTIVKNDSFLVDLKALEDNLTLMELKLSVPTRKQAVSLCAKWQKNPSDLYNKIITLLFSEDTQQES
jgi:predicted transcriptional regulator